MPKNLARLSVIAATLAAAVSIAPSAIAAPAANNDLCKFGGYANYVDPATGHPFKNPGQCVSFMNGGGVLVPVEEEPPGEEPTPGPVATVTERPLSPGSEGYYSVWLHVNGLDPAVSFEVRTFWRGQSEYGVIREQDAEANGTYDLYSYEACDSPIERFELVVPGSNRTLLTAPGLPEYTACP